MNIVYLCQRRKVGSTQIKALIKYAYNLESKRKGIKVLGHGRTVTIQQQCARLGQKEGGKETNQAVAVRVQPRASVGLNQDVENSYGKEGTGAK